MNIFELISMSWESLMSKKSRSFLSGLGIMIGVFVVILMGLIGEAATGMIDEQFESLNPLSIMVSSNPVDGQKRNKLSLESLSLLLERSVFLDNGTILMQGTQSITNSKNTMSASILGATPDYFSINSLGFSAGRSFSDYDLESRQKKVVIGKDVLEELFENTSAEEALGMDLFVNRTRVEIIGVLQESAANPFTNNNGAVFFPFSTAETQILGRGGRISMSLIGKSTSVLPLAEQEIKIILRDLHELSAEDVDDFKVRNMGSMVSSLTMISSILSLLLSGVALIILLVSGIGIMNVMFVTVSERTREIGIVKSIGAKQKDVLSQFLVEAILLSILSGIVGIILGVIVNLVFLRFNLVAEFAFTGIFQAFFFSLFVGIGFGFYPAYKASKLDPIDALRSD